MHGTLIALEFFFHGFDLYAPAFGRLIRREFVSDELPSLIKDIFTSNDVDDRIIRLPKDDAQAFVNVIDQARRAYLFIVTNLPCGTDTVH